jgi:hypothetical protein
MSETFWWQSAALFWASVCFFRAGARSNGIAMSAREWRGVVQAALIVVLLFALLTDWRGCRSVGDAANADALCTHTNTC